MTDFSLRLASDRSGLAAELPSPSKNGRIAVLIPCHNEEAAIRHVVRGFKAALPDAVVHVYDNASTDRTANLAVTEGAVIGFEPSRGKGRVVRRMFADVEADVYVLVDGDATYDPADAATMIQLLQSRNLDMVIGARKASESEAYRPGHQFGNRLLNRVVAELFGDGVSDLLSGYRAFSRRFVKSFPGLATGFEIETELTVHALELGLPLAEVETVYRSRPVGSNSKLATVRDGARIAVVIGMLYKNERPLFFFGVVALILSVAAMLVGAPVIVTFADTGLVPRLPSAVLATGLSIMAALAFVTGLVLDTVTRGRKELKRLAYLSQGTAKS